MTRFALESAHRDGTAAFQVTGDVDVEHEDALRAALHQSIEAGEADIVLDLSGVTFLSEGALGVLLGALRAQQERGGALRLSRVSPFVQHKLTRTGLLRLFFPAPHGY
jgi:anti-sigma B factor antagonist